VRNTLKASGPLGRSDRHKEWLEAQENDKHAKYDAQCKARGWTLIPFVMDCYGALGGEALSFGTKMVQRLTGQKDFWLRRKTEDTVWQGLSLTLARDLARQLVWSRYSGGG
jgi:hypothetical protein